MTSDDKISNGQNAIHQSKYVELSQIVAGLAHEIKNPLSTINLNLKLLGEDLARYHDDEHERLARRLQRVQDETHRVRQTLDDFLRYAGKYELHKTRTDLKELLSNLYDFFLPQAEACGVILRNTVPAESVYCDIDVNLIKQALLNLMINASQAMAEGGELLIKLTNDDEQATVEVIDTGAGIEQSKIDAIFQPYWSSKSDGSGLGLPTARRIVREHGGALQVESEVGKGTRFLLRLPLDRSDSSRAKAE
ncbi:MAG: HAMP domain-containing histidine kinase [Phycisphaerae bacterium]|nr:HAMP domain-containing histidine kinase [Phycisphaerae bacterium]